MEQSYLNDFEIQILNCEKVDDRLEQEIKYDARPRYSLHYTVQVTYKHSTIPMQIQYKVCEYNIDLIVDKKVILDYICEKVRYFTKGTWTHQIDITGKSYFNKEFNLNAIDVLVYNAWKNIVDDFKCMLGDEHFANFVRVAL